MSLHRRTFLKTLGTLAACTAVGPNLFGYNFAGATPGRRLVIVEANGGFDGLSLVIPNDAALFPSYGTKRDVTGYDSSELNNTALNGEDFALHPTMTALAELWNVYGQLAIVHKVGYPRPANLSHFVSQDIWASGSRTDFSSGWIGRLSTTPSDGGILKVGAGTSQLLELQGGGVPLIFKALDDFVVPVNDNFLQDSVLRNKIANDIEVDLAPPNGIVGAFNTAKQSSVALVQQIQGSIGGYVDPPGGYPGTTLAQNLRDVARLIHAGGIDPALETNVCFTATGGFDTHSDQKPRLAGRWGEVNGAIAAFVEDMRLKGEWNNTVLVVLTEFGRRNTDNGSGTDHGYGNVMLVAGGCINGGMKGDVLVDADLSSADDYIDVTTDFRQPLGDLLKQHLGIAASEVDNTVFSEYTPGPSMGLLGC